MLGEDEDDGAAAAAPMAEEQEEQGEQGEEASEVAVDLVEEVEEVAEEVEVQQQEPQDMEVEADEGGQAPERLTQLPVSRVKAIARSDPEITMLNQEAVLLLTKATVCLVCVCVCAYVCRILQGEPLTLSRTQ